MRSEHPVIVSNDAVADKSDRREGHWRERRDRGAADNRARGSRRAVTVRDNPHRHADDAAAYLVSNSKRPRRSRAMIPAKFYYVRTASLPHAIELLQNNP